MTFDLSCITSYQGFSKCLPSFRRTAPFESLLNTLAFGTFHLGVFHATILPLPSLDNNLRNRRGTIAMSLAQLGRSVHNYFFLERTFFRSIVGTDDEINLCFLKATALASFSLAVLRANSDLGIPSDPRKLVTQAFLISNIVIDLHAQKLREQERSLKAIQTWEKLKESEETFVVLNSSYLLG